MIDPKTIKAATYKGKIESLRGKRALVRLGQIPADPDRPLTWLAQFDQRDLMLGNKRLDIGWHEFPHDAFDVDLDFNAAD